MPGTPFGASVRADGDKSIIDLTGDIDRSATDQLETAYEAAMAIGGGLVLNFDDVDYINSTGIALIVSVLAKARAADRDVSAFGLSDHYLEIFRITRLSDFIGIYDDEKAAVAAAGI